MTTHPQSRRDPMPMIEPFPIPGTLVQLAYRELHLAVNGTDEQKEQLGNPALLPRPWEPSSCLDPELRLQVWQWLENVVIWLNREYTWDAAAMIPTCWAHHPHLVHEIAVVADQRRRGGLGNTSDALEEWHRYCLPAFIDRMRTRLKAHCEDEHVRWPGRSRHNEHISSEVRDEREETFVADIDTLPASRQPAIPPAAPPTKKRLAVVDTDTGEIRAEYGAGDE